jgi:hypothetical protein
MEKQMHVSTCSIADAASGFFYSGLMLQWRLGFLGRNKRAARLAGSPTSVVARFTCL